jgi:hypothetical protein
MDNVYEKMGHFRRDVVAIKMLLLEMKDILSELRNLLDGLVSR